MSFPVIAITNASTCLADTQVGAVLPALQKQVSDDFKAYWEFGLHAFVPAERPTAHARVVANCRGG